MFIFYFWERVQAEGVCGERGWTDDPKKALRWQQRAWRGARTHKLWDRDLRRSRMLNLLSHPGAPSFLSLMNKDAVNLLYRFPYKRWVSISLDECPRVQLLGHVAVVVHKKLPRCFPDWLCHFTLPPSVHTWSGFFTSLPALDIITIF